jgi:hypothetical protein
MTVKEKKKPLLDRGEVPMDYIAGYDVYRMGEDHVLCDPLAKKPLLVPSSQQNAFLFFHSRWQTALVFFLVLAEFMGSWKIPFWIGFAYGGVMEVLYRLRWLPSLTGAEGFVKDRPFTPARAMEEAQNMPRILLLMVLYIVFGILIVINAFQMQMPSPVIAGAFLLLGLLAAASWNCFLALRNLH